MRFRAAWLAALIGLFLVSCGAGGVGEGPVADTTGATVSDLPPVPPDRPLVEIPARNLFRTAAEQPKLRAELQSSFKSAQVVELDPESLPGPLGSDRSRTVVLDFGAGEPVEATIYPGLPIENGMRWQGRVTGEESSAVALTRVGEVYEGFITCSRGEFSITWSGAGASHVAGAVEESPMQCGTDGSLAPPEAADPSSPSKPSEARKSEAASVTLPTNAPVIDLAFLYTQNVADARRPGGTLAEQEHAMLLLAHTTCSYINLCLLNSEASDGSVTIDPVRIRCSGVYLVSGYVESAPADSSLTTDADRFVDNALDTPGLTKSLDDTGLQSTASIAQADGADAFCLLVQGTTRTQNGKAAVIGGAGNDFNGALHAGNCRVVVDANNIKVPRTTAHELGHLLGCWHNAETGSIPNATFPFYSAGWISVQDSNGIKYADVMAYPQSVSPRATPVAYFSTPRASVNGVPIGSATLGDCARQISNFWQYIADNSDANLTRQEVVTLGPGWNLVSAFSGVTHHLGPIDISDPSAVTRIEFWHADRQTFDPGAPADNADFRAVWLYNDKPQVTYTYTGTADYGETSGDGTGDPNLGDQIPEIALVPGWNLVGAPTPIGPSSRHFKLDGTDLPAALQAEPPPLRKSFWAWDPFSGFEELDMSVPDTVLPDKRGFWVNNQSTGVRKLRLSATDG
ncbi:hypothetical protein DYH09_04635 [bacterium CPR1]|nr:hypothetical protein [bacterium CPR1]